MILSAFAESHRTIVESLVSDSYEFRRKPVECYRNFKGVPILLDGWIRPSSYRIQSGIS